MGDKFSTYSLRFPYGRKCVVTVIEIGLQSISTIVTTRLTTIWKPGLSLRAAVYINDKFAMIE